MSLRGMALMLAVLCSACTTAAKRADDTFANGGITQSRAAVTAALKSPLRSGGFGELAEAPTPELCTSPTADMLNKLAQDYSSTLAACEVKLNKYETRADSSRKLSVGLALFGALAGSVVVPTLSAGSAAKSAIAAWGGVAGATNLAQRSLNDQGLDAATYVARREMIRTDLLPALKRYSSPQSNYCTRVTAVTEMAAACVAYAIAGNQAPQSPDTEPAPAPTEQQEATPEETSPAPGEPGPDVSPEPAPAEPAPVEPPPAGLD